MDPKRLILLLKEVKIFKKVGFIISKIFEEHRGIDDLGNSNGNYASLRFDFFRQEGLQKVNQRFLLRK